MDSPTCSISGPLFFFSLCFSPSSLCLSVSPSLSHCPPSLSSSSLSNLLPPVHMHRHSPPYVIMYVVMWLCRAYHS